MSKTIATENAPAAIGPYVQGVDGREIVQVFHEYGRFHNVAYFQASGFHDSFNDFATVNATYEAFFTEHNATFPARSCVEVARLPKDVKIEIEAIAVRR